MSRLQSQEIPHVPPTPGEEKRSEGVMIKKVIHSEKVTYHTDRDFMRFFSIFQECTFLRGTIFFICDVITIGSREIIQKKDVWK